MFTYEIANEQPLLVKYFWESVNVELAIRHAHPDIEPEAQRVLDELEAAYKDGWLAFPACVVLRTARQFVRQLNVDRRDAVVGRGLVARLSPTLPPGGNILDHAAACSRAYHYVRAAAVAAAS